MESNTNAFRGWWSTGTGTRTGAIGGAAGVYPLQQQQRLIELEEVKVMKAIDIRWRSAN